MKKRPIQHRSGNEMIVRNSSSLLQFSNKLMNFYWKIKWKFIHSARGRGIEIQIHSKVPSVGVTSSVGKTTTCRMVAHILVENGKKVALATTQGTYVGQDVIRRGDSASGNYAINGRTEFWQYSK